MGRLICIVVSVQTFLGVLIKFCVFTSCEKKSTLDTVKKIIIIKKAKWGQKQLAEALADISHHYISFCLWHSHSSSAVPQHLRACVGFFYTYCRRRWNRGNGPNKPLHSQCIVRSANPQRDSYNEIMHWQAESSSSPCLYCGGKGYIQMVNRGNAGESSDISVGARAFSFCCGRQSTATWLAGRAAAF